MSKLKCIGCEKPPAEITEYQSEARMNKTTPDQFVLENEPIGCWGVKAGPHAFYCTKCYIEAGSPLRSKTLR